jgi:multidrug resistance efflux pump
VTMLEPSQLWVQVYVPETGFVNVCVGQGATIVADGTPDARSKGTSGRLGRRRNFC